MPLVGIRCRVDAMLMIPCRPKEADSADAERMMNRLLSFMEISIERICELIEMLLIFVTDDLLIDKEIRYDENNICRI